MELPPAVSYSTYSTYSTVRSYLENLGKTITFTFIRRLAILGQDLHPRSQDPSGWTVISPIALSLSTYLLSIAARTPEQLRYVL